MKQSCRISCNLQEKKTSLNNFCVRPTVAEITYKKRLHPYFSLLANDTIPDHENSNLNFLCKFKLRNEKGKLHPNQDARLTLY